MVNLINDEIRINTKLVSKNNSVKIYNFVLSNLSFSYQTISVKAEFIPQ